jgi:hypothetical protein
MNTHTLFTPALLLRKWREQRPSNQGDFGASVRGLGLVLICYVTMRVRVSLHDSGKETDFILCVQFNVKLPRQHVAAGAESELAGNESQRRTQPSVAC